MIDWMDEHEYPTFPDTRLALDSPNGLLVAGGCLSPLWLSQSYQRGIFPWYEPGTPMLWWSPAPRAVITPESFRIPRTVRKLINKTRCTVTYNQRFEDVIHQCATVERRDENGETTHDTWISDEMAEAYTRLHHAGLAFSFEYWNKDGALAGGFYGVQRGKVFFGESMFSKENNASQITFATVAPLLFHQGITMIDCQMHTQHMARFGLIEQEREHFEEHLSQSVKAALSLSLPTLIHTGLHTP